ncbi:MAG: hypothetical protein J6S14_21955 [Clostridia bacterium]|nr:hypothetical protein [Clostridia bacterium]
MQSLCSNRSRVYYALYEGKTDRTIEGLKTGGKNKVYGDAIPLNIYVSPNRGSAEVQQFGINDDYTNVMVTARTDLPIDTDSVLWIGFGVLPEYDPGAEYAEGDTLLKDGKIVRYKSGEFPAVPHNYTVQKVAPWKNSTVYAIREVKAS